MRWKYPQNGEIRQRTIFAWRPWYFDGTAYWLEKLVVEEVYIGCINTWGLVNLRPLIPSQRTSHDHNTDTPRQES